MTSASTLSSMTISELIRQCEASEDPAARELVRRLNGPIDELCKAPSLTVRGPEQLEFPPIPSWVFSDGEVAALEDEFSQTAEKDSQSA